jgi:hypothetical protein
MIRKIVVLKKAERKMQYNYSYQAARWYCGIYLFS